MKNVKTGVSALLLTVCATGVSAKDIEFSDLYASSFEVGATSSEDRSGTRIALDWSLTENIAVEGQAFNYNDEAFSEVIDPANPNSGAVITRLRGVELSYGVRFQHVFYDVINTPISAYVTAGNVKISFDDVVIDDEEDSTETGNNEDESFSLPKEDVLYYGVGTKWFVNNRTSFDFSYIVYDQDERDSRASTNGTLSASLKYAPVEHFGLSVDYTNEDAFGERRTSVSVFVRW